jgi:hypothetical protein
MSAKTYNITIEQGATFRLNVRWLDPDDNPIDITGYTARMQVRRRYNDPDAVLSLTSDDGDIAIGNEAGTVDVTASADDTAAIGIKCGVYDLELESPAGTVTRLLEGSAVISPEVTR